MNIRAISNRIAIVSGAVMLMASPGFGSETTKAFLGNWALTIPGGGAGGLGVTGDQGRLSASILAEIKGTMTTVQAAALNKISGSVTMIGP